MKIRKNIKRLMMTLCMAVMTVAASAQNEAINNETILTLLKEGFSSEEIIGAIENSTERTIQYSIDYMRQLKAAGADAALTTYIQKIAKQDFGYEGILWWNPTDGGKPKKMFRTQFEKESKGFNLGTIAAMGAGALLVGSAVSGNKPSGGVAASTGKDIQKLMLPGATSKLQMEGDNGRHPVFRFYFPKRDPESFQQGADNWYQIVMSSIQNPNEFQCIKMQVKEPKKSGKGSNRNIIDFEINEINNNTFEVTFPKGLEPGEYCFFYKGGLGSDSFKEHPFGFDFTVK